MRCQRSLLVSFLFLFHIAAPGAFHCWAADKGPAERIIIEADRMESKQKENTVTFFGHVEARQGDMRINADQMTIFYKQHAEKNSGSPGNVSQNIDKLAARGNVVLIRQDWNASGDAIDYFAQERKIVLTGNTRVLRNNNLITGEKIVLFLDEGKSVVESGAGNNGRVTAIINPEKATEQSKKQKVKASQ